MYQGELNLLLYYVFKCINIKRLFLLDWIRIKYIFFLISDFIMIVKSLMEEMLIGLKVCIQILWRFVCKFVDKDYINYFLFEYVFFGVF